MSLDFSSHNLIVGNEGPSSTHLEIIFDGRETTFSIGDTHYLIETTNIDNKHFWLYARYGKSFPYSSTVYNTKEKNEEDNPRTTAQVEPSNQLFGLYSVTGSTLYCSNIKKKGFFENYIKSKLNVEIAIKAFLTDADSFLRQVKNVEKVKFVAKNTLFSQNGEIMNIFPVPQDVFGLGMPEDFSLEANFNNARITDSFINKLKQMVNWTNSSEAESLMCIGRDDHNFETVFNASTFIKKISIAATKDDQGMYDPEVVKQALLSKIRGEGL